MRRRGELGPVPEPELLPGDVFATDFDVHDWADWLRIVCWVDVVEPNDNGGRASRRPAAALVLPRSAVASLVKALRYSIGHHPAEPRRKN